MKQRVVALNLAGVVFIWPGYIVTWALGQDMYDVMPVAYANTIEIAMSVVVKTAGLMYAFYDPASFDPLEPITTVLELIAG